MNTPFKQYKKYQQRSLKENTLCCIAGLFCFFVLLYALFILLPFVGIVLEHLTHAVQVMNNAVRGSYV